MDAGHLARLLHPAELLDQALGGDELVTGEGLREVAAAAPSVTAWASRPTRHRLVPERPGGVEGACERVALRRLRGADLDGGVDAGGPSCSPAWVR